MTLNRIASAKEALTRQLDEATHRLNTARGELEEAYNECSEVLRDFWSLEALRFGVMEEAHEVALLTEEIEEATT